MKTCGHTVILGGTIKECIMEAGHENAPDGCFGHWYADLGPAPVEPLIPEFHGTLNMEKTAKALLMVVLSAGVMLGILAPLVHEVLS